MMACLLSILLFTSESDALSDQSADNVEVEHTLNMFQFQSSIKDSFHVPKDCPAKYIGDTL